MAHYQGPIIDVDTHHQPKSAAELLKYFPPEWVEYANANPRAKFSSSPNGGSFGLLGAINIKADSVKGGGAKGTSFELYREQHLERDNYYRTMLLHQLGDQGTHTNIYLARALCSALNDWNIDTWLTYDERLVSAIVVPSAEPEEAAKEIRRVGSHPKMKSVLLCGNPFGRPFGDPLFHPIYEAASELGLPVAIHSNNWYDRPNASMLMVGGWINHLSGSSSAQQGMHYMSSFLVHGVFEKFPKLHVVVTEFGLGWLPSVISGLDENYKLLRLESPWVKRWPSEYIHDHMSMSTQPIEESPDDKGALAELLSTIDGIEDMLCFSTDYPHGTMDVPEYVERLLPQAWWPKIFLENAARIYNIELPAAVPA